MKLIHPDAGTVVECEGDLASTYLSRGWRDASAPVVQKAASSDKPQVRRSRSRASDR